MYKDSTIKYTGELIRFKTFATDVPNRRNREFIRQKEFLRNLAQRLGLNFNDVGGFVQEIWIGGGSESFGIMSHSDVQPVDSTGWIRDPWSGAIIDGTIWGRGAIDDKGPIVAVMYGMRALLDSGLPIRKKIVLLVGTDEESANDALNTYLKPHKPPDQTIVVDSNFPVICAEKGWCGAWLELPKSNTPPAGFGPYVVHLSSGFSESIVPDKAVAKLMVAGARSRDAVRVFTTLLETKARTFMEKRHGSKLTVEIAGDTVVINAFGKSVHSSIPRGGHNALMDLLVFLDRDIQPLRNDYALMAKFAATNIGFELDGKSLGIGHHDAFMGDVTVAADMFQPTDTTVMFMFNFRVPKGMERKRIEQALQKRYGEFNKRYGVKLKATHYISSAVYTDPASPFVQKLLGIYNSVTGENRQPQSIGGGTYAKRLPNAVVFGPAMPDEEYLGHQHNEHIKISTLIRNIELLTHAMVEFGM
ncbi:MAG: Sapep family Mn(2+)-dependent dipeptidase [Bacteroidota bacterium]